MKTFTLLKFAASSLTLGVIATGCSPGGGDRVSSASDTSQQVKFAAKASASSTKLMQKQKYAGAVIQAEAAVAAAPQNVDYRVKLGQAYLASGRFVSAEAAFSDALSLDPSHAKASLNLALAQIATGKSDRAMQTLDDHRTALSAADYGLAVALAGDPAGAVDLLEIAVRDGRADMKLRQNLALVYALAGKWNNARVMAAQDLSPHLIDDRMTQWAQFVQPGTAPQQVATLLGVTAVEDSGQPERLALRSDAAQVASVDAPVVSISEPVADPVIIEPAAPVFEMAAQVKPALIEAPLIRSEVKPLKQVVLPAEKPATKASLRPAVARQVAKPRGVNSGQFVVQLGAFATPVRAEAAWNGAMSKTAELTNYKPATSRVTLKAGSLYRMSVSGFTSREAASQICTKVKSSGGTCFIRSIAGDAPTQWVQRGGAKVAVR